MKFGRHARISYDLDLETDSRSYTVKANETLPVGARVYALHADVNGQTEMRFGVHPGNADLTKNIDTNKDALETLAEMMYRSTMGLISLEGWSDVSLFQYVAMYKFLYPDTNFVVIGTGRIDAADSWHASPIEQPIPFEGHLVYICYENCEAYVGRHWFYGEADPTHLKQIRDPKLLTQWNRLCKKAFKLRDKRREIDSKENRKRILPEARKLAPLVRKAVTMNRSNVPDNEYREIPLNDPVEYLRELCAYINVNYLNAVREWETLNASMASFPTEEPIDEMQYPTWMLRPMPKWITNTFFDEGQTTLNELGRRFVDWNNNYWPKRVKEEEEDDADL